MTTNCSVTPKITKDVKHPIEPDTHEIEEDGMETSNEVTHVNSTTICDTPTNVYDTTKTVLVRMVKMLRGKE